MSFENINETYNVKAKAGKRVKYTYPTPSRKGTIVGTCGTQLLIHMDGDKDPRSYHPTWELKYLSGAEAK